jgi:hypothetical protein
MKTLGPATTRPGGSFEISVPQKEHSSLRTKFFVTCTSRYSLEAND